MDANKCLVLAAIGATAAASISNQSEKETTMKLYVSFFIALLSLLAPGLASVHAQPQVATAPPFVTAAGGKALSITETEDGPVAREINTKRRVVEAFGFGADGSTLIYTALNEANLPAPGLFAENVNTGDFRRISDKIILAARWSPRADFAVGYIFADEHGTGVAVVNITTGAEYVLTRENVLPDVLEWDASGVRLFYMRAEDESQLVYKQGGKRPVDERAYSVLTRRAVKFNEAGVPDLAGPADAEAKDAPAQMPSVKRRLRPGEFPYAVYDDAPPLPSDLYAYTVKSADGAEIIGDNLLGEGAIRVRAGPGGPEREIARGQLLSALGRGAVVREFKPGETIVSYVAFDGQMVAVASTTVTYGFPLASAVVTQGGSGYGRPGNCNLYDHSGSMSYAYDLQSPTAGAHVMAPAAGLVVSTRKDVSCNSCDTKGCSIYSSACRGEASNFGWGNAVVIKHADNSYTKITHLKANSVQVSVGDNVVAGRYIGQQGSTGCSIGNMEGCGSHVHVERQTSAALNGTSVAITFSDTSANPLTCGATYRSGLTETTSDRNVGTIYVRATLDGAPWSGLLSFTFGSLSAPDATSVPAMLTNRPAGGYGIRFISGGPSGANFDGITPSTFQDLRAGGSVTWTFAFRSMARSVISVDAKLDGSTWNGPLKFRLSGPSPADGTYAPQAFSSRAAGSYTVSYVSGGPLNARLVSITPSATQTLGSTGKSFTLNFTSSIKINSISPGEVLVNKPTVLTVSTVNARSPVRAFVTTSHGTFEVAQAGIWVDSAARVRVQVTMGGTALPLNATLKLQNPDGQSSTGTFRVVAAAPSINSISPSTVRLNQTTVLTVSGANFRLPVRAYVITSQGTFQIATSGITFVSGNQVRVSVRMGGTTSYGAQLRLVNPDGQSATRSFQVAR
jgi:murein DD-endopeptidase MepM/ murein hydrolase activator NlpD